jgi:hypothetical protein
LVFDHPIKSFTKKSSKKEGTLGNKLFVLLTSVIFLIILSLTYFLYSETGNCNCHTNYISHPNHRINLTLYRHYGRIFILVYNTDAIMSVFLFEL